MLIEALQDFLEFLRYNRNLSPHTLRGYETDLTQFLSFTAAESHLNISELPLDAFDDAAVRGFLASLHARGNSRSSTARRLQLPRARSGRRTRSP